jgi:Peptidase family M23
MTRSDNSLLLCSLVWLAGLNGTALAQPNVAQGEVHRSSRSTAQLTPVLATVFSAPRWFVGDDGKVHLVYELFLTNALRVPATVTQLDVLDGSTGRMVTSLSGDDLKGAMSLVGSGDTSKVTLGSSEVGAVWFDVALSNTAALPTTVKHRLTVQIPPGLPIPETVTTTTPSVTVDLRPPVVLGPPITGNQWVAVGSCCDGPHRRALQPIDGKLYLSQRFAIDFNRLDAANRFSSGNPARVTSYPTYGQAVLAVGDGTVVAAVDQYPDQIAGETSGVTLANADGNHIVLDLGDGRFAFYAHLKPGSVRVKRGDAVTRGQQIGEAGNSGSSDGPHLHFHVMNGPSVLESDGIPYVFADFALTGRIPPLDKALKYYVAQQPVPIDPAAKGERRNELPLSGAVVTFTAPSR